jgi:hypothetical protein
MSYWIQIKAVSSIPAGFLDFYVQKPYISLYSLVFCIMPCIRGLHSHVAPTPYISGCLMLYIDSTYREAPELKMFWERYLSELADTSRKFQLYDCMAEVLMTN